MQEYNYHLEKYHGRDSRHECPQCGDKHSFAYYVDAAGNIIDKLVGRCNHESSCGYHYTPKEWYRDNPDGRPQKRHNRPRPQSRPQPRQPDFIDPELVIRSSSFDSSLVYYLCGLIPNDTIRRVWEDYAVGATKDGRVIYWQIDATGKARTGKVMRYDPTTGHRVKDAAGVNWVHSILIRKGQLPPSFNLVQCLFGERLLALYPDQAVALVESEKTALIGAALYPDFVWLATGGKTQLAPAKMKVLSGRRVIAFPDVDGFEVWKAKARDLAAAGINITVSDILEKNATPEERERNIDIADWLLEQLSQVSQCGTSGTVGHPVTVTAYNPARQLAEVIERWPRLAVLADRLKLELIDTSELL